MTSGVLALRSWTSSGNIVGLGILVVDFVEAVNIC